MVVKRLKGLVFFMIYVEWGIGCSCNGGIEDRGSDITDWGVERRDGVKYCNGETGRYPGWDDECRGNVGCTRREVFDIDIGCYCSLCRGEECVSIGCRGNGGRDTGVEDTNDAG